MKAVLNITTEYSLLKSLVRIPELMTFLREEDINACGICDENLYGVMEFYNACIQNSIKPIIGMKIKVNNLELYLYAMNFSGYKNLLSINNIKEQRKLTIDDLNKYSGDILLIIPYESISILDNIKFYKYIYFSYKNNAEEENLLKLGYKAIYLNDIRALLKEDVKYLKYLDLLRKEDTNYIDSYYKSYSSNILEEITNLLNIKIEYESNYIPKYSTDSYKLLESLSYKGLSKRLNNNLNNEYKNRLNYELSVIKSMGYVDYFLIVYDYVLYAKKNDIMVGPGRGSAAGSLVSYAIGITEIDPLKYGLLFERFLNPKRVSMPDIDIDFDALKREKVIDYVREKYGKDNVALGLTFITYKSKLILRDLGKILAIGNNLLDKFVSLIDSKLSLKDNLKNDKIKSYLNNYDVLRNLYDIATHLEGLKKSTSIHAAGVVIANKSIASIIPVHYENNILITGLTMDNLEQIGLLKMDFLALKNLTTISNILKSIGLKNLNNIAVADKEVYNLFKSGKTEGIFQFETPLLKNLVTKLKPDKFTDLVDAIALGRPGPINELDTYIKRKNREEKVNYPIKDLESILSETRGIIIYQEQIIKILTNLAGYSYAEADIIRRAISKKKESVLESERTRFISNCKQRNIPTNISEGIYNLIVKFAAFGFNKSHSVSYALISYQMAYLKVHYPDAFIIEMLNNEGVKNLDSALRYLKLKNIKLLKPCINYSQNRYLLKNNYLLLPLECIKSISRNISDSIINSRGCGYSDFYDFVYKTREFLKEEELKDLIKAGALDCFNLNKKTLIENLSNAITYASLGDLEITKPSIVEYPEYEEQTLREFEKNSYGFYISNHPSCKYNGIKLDRINEYLFKNIICVVLVEKIKVIKTKKGEDMAFILASDEICSKDFTVFPSNFKYLDDIKVGDVIKVWGSVTKRYVDVNIIVNNIKKVE